MLLYRVFIDCITLIHTFEGNIQKRINNIPIFRFLIKFAFWMIVRKYMFNMYLDIIGHQNTVKSSNVRHYYVAFRTTMKPSIG